MIVLFTYLVKICKVTNSNSREVLRQHVLQMHVKSGFIVNSSGGGWVGVGADNAVDIVRERWG